MKRILFVVLIFGFGGIIGNIEAVAAHNSTTRSLGITQWTGTTGCPLPAPAPVRIAFRRVKPKSTEPTSLLVLQKKCA